MNTRAAMPNRSSNIRVLPIFFLLALCVCVRVSPPMSKTSLNVLCALFFRCNHNVDFAYVFWAVCVSLHPYQASCMDKIFFFLFLLFSRFLSLERRKKSSQTFHIKIILFMYDGGRVGGWGGRKELQGEFFEKRRGGIFFSAPSYHKHRTFLILNITTLNE